MTEVETTEGEGTKTERPCQCYTEEQYVLGEENDGGFPAGVPVYGQCGRTTRRQFAIGHDAKLKSVLIKLNRADLPYMVLQGGMLTDKDPAQVAAERGWERFLTPAKPKAEPKAKKAPAKKAAAKKAKVA